MTIRGINSVVAVESAKLAMQWKVRIALAACLAGPFAFAVAMRVQSTLPSDTLFGRAVNDSGLAIPLVVLGFAGLWALPALASVVAGDLFSSEDRFGTWPTLLTRSRTRAEMFTGKVVTALGFALLAVIVLAASSIIAGTAIIGRQPLIGLTGIELAPNDAMARVALAWASVVPAALACTTLAIAVSVATRSSAAGIALPVVIALTMQLYALVDGPEAFRRVLITSGFIAWRGLLAEPAYVGPIADTAIVSGWYVVVCLSTAYYLLRNRDIGG